MPAYGHDIQLIIPGLEVYLTPDKQAGKRKQKTPKA